MTERYAADLAELSTSDTSFLSIFCAGLLEFVCFSTIEAAPFEEALRRASFREMQALEIDISKAGKGAEYGYRLGVDGWSGDPDGLKVRAGKVAKFREYLPQLDDDAELASRYPVTRRTLQRRYGGMPTD